MKYLLCVLILLSVSCGNRKKKLDIQKETTKTVVETKESQIEEKEVVAETKTDYSQFFDGTDFKIISNGGDYKLQFGNFHLSGNADVEFSKKKEETVYKTKEKIHTTYRKETTYWSHITYKTHTFYKTLNVESKKPMFWLYLLIYLLGVATIPTIKILIKKQV